MIMARQQTTLLFLVLLFGLILCNHTPDQRCQKNSDCDEANTTMCCGFKYQKEGTGEKGFTCYDKKDLTYYGIQCMSDSQTYCDYCALGTYCCSYETNLVKGLSAWCKLNTTYMDLSTQEYAPN